MSEEEMANRLCGEQPWARGREKDVVSWLENFDPGHRGLAMRLLDNVKVYCKEDFERWCQRLYSNLPRDVRNSNDTFYVGLGLPSESGSLVSYYFRTSNGLPPEVFLDFKEAADGKNLKHRQARNLVFLDDFIGSGNQAVEFWQSLSSYLGRDINELSLYYLAFFSRRGGKQNVEKHTGFRVHVVRQLDESNEAFGSTSKVFDDGCREIAREIFREYGLRLFPKHPLGFRDGQMLIVLDHNTPNNTLPILWSSEDNWFPLFKRYNKVRLPVAGRAVNVELNSGKESRAIMFVEQVSATPSIAGRTPSEIGEAISEQGLLTAQAVRHYGGAIVKNLGDKALVQFSALRDALGCGFALQKRVKDRNANQKNDRLTFELRIGIDSGEVLMVPDGNLVGAAIGRAARICSRCPPGKIYCSASVMSEIGDDQSRLSLVGHFLLRSDRAVEEPIYSLVNWSPPSLTSPNPFIWRGGITSELDFFDRDTEQQMIRDYLRGRQNCQVVGSRRIGKTSLLRQVERSVRRWEGDGIETAYIDLQSPRSFTLAGWLEHAGQQLNLARTPRSLADFYEGIESLVSSGRHPVLLMDEFEEFSLRPTEFSREFFTTLRSCGHLGLSTITASRRPINEISAPTDLTSPFYNTFALVSLEPFSEANVESFLKAEREGMTPFTELEREAIRAFAKGHPLALQIAGFHIVKARRTGESIAAATRRANDDMTVHLPAWQT